MSDHVNFNGSVITRRNANIYSISQTEKLRGVVFAKTQADLESTRAKLQYVGCCTRPDLCSSVQLLASQVISNSVSCYNKLNNIIKWCHETSAIGLTFVPLDKSSLRLMLFTDASFANANKLKSQIGFILVLADASNNANIIHYGSMCCKRVTRSVMAAELLALVHGFDNAYLAQHILQEILDQDIPIDGFVDSRTVFNVVAKSSATLEKRLQIDVNSLRESHGKGELRCLSWIPGSENYADGLTKHSIDSTHPLWSLIKTNKVDVNPQGWIENTTPKLDSKEKPGV